MDFIEAVKAMKEGKKVKYNDAFFRLEDGWLYKTFEGSVTQTLSLSEINNDCWEIIEEKKTLFDKEVNIVYQKVEVGNPLDTEIDTKKGYFKDDVKEALKEFTDWIEKTVAQNSITQVNKKAKEIFGEELI